MPKEMHQIQAQTRERIGTRYARRLRDAGRLPAVIYGHGEGSASVSVDATKFRDILEGHEHLVEVLTDGQSQPCLIKEVQWDHLGRWPVHVDLTRVNLEEEVQVEVEIVLRGEPKALDTPGAVLSQPLNILTVTCKANNIPDNIRHDIGELTLDDTITVADLTLPEGVTAVDDPETAVAQITIVAELPEEEELEATGNEPEVIGKADGEEGEDADEDDE